jgi:hypothetical protein
LLFVGSGRGSLELVFLLCVCIIIVIKQCLGRLLCRSTR